MGSIRGKLEEMSQRVQKSSTLHRSSGVVIDIATFKVSHAVGVDIHATALQAKKRSA